MEDDFGEKNNLLIEYLVESGFLKTRRVIEAFERFPRHMFVPQQSLGLAYADIALPTVGQSTISQPSIVAMMLEALAPKEGDLVLEVGTGSGWQAALLSHCVGTNGKVVTIDIEPEVVAFAKANVSRTKAKNIETVLGDGSAGYRKGAPYNKIIFAVALPEVTEAITSQLKPGGRMVAPVGSYTQTLTVIDKDLKGKLDYRDIGAALFVPMQRGK